MGSMKDVLIDMENEGDDLFDEEAEYTDQEDDYKAQCAQLMDMVKKANQNTEALLTMLQKQSSGRDALVKERSGQKSEASVQREYGIYRENRDDRNDFPAIGDFTYYKSADYWECGRTRAKTSLFDLGKQGWEGFTTDYSGGSVFSILMKRRIQ